MQDEHTKTVYLVRHAQSEQNVATASLHRGEPSALIDMIRLGYDAPVSEAGQQQLKLAQQRLDGFAAQRGIELVAHSPLQRARATAEALFSGHRRPLLTLPALHERTVSEYFFPWLLDARIREVHDWLGSREERVVALVGHGQFFKRCLGAEAVQPNVSVIESTFRSSSGFSAAPGGLAFEGFAEPGGDDVGH